jgi:hypothetical protein
MLKAGLAVAILDAAIMAFTIYIGQFFHLTSSTQGVLVYAVIGKLLYMAVINTTCFSIANLFISSSRNFPRTILLSLALCMSFIAAIICSWRQNDIKTEITIFSAIIENPLLFATIFLPIVAAYAICYYFARRADKTTQ